MNYCVFIKKAFLIQLFIFSSMVMAVDKQQINIAYFSQERSVPPALSNLDPFIKHKGVVGAELAIKDNNTTGQFTGQQYNLHKFIVPVGGDLVKAFNEQLTDFNFIVVNLPTESLKQVAGFEAAQSKLLFNVGSDDDDLRQRQCAKNLLHIIPSRAMRADALAQYMMKKRWRKWFLVIGPTPEDKLYANAVSRAAKRFGMKIVEQKDWTHTFDARRTAQSDVPVFTQGVEYDVLVVADEQGLFGEYLEYRTWIPRPVIGTQGLVATSWHRTHEQWGAVQIQNRFKEAAGRWMQEQDYGAYLAVRAIGEAATRTQSNELAAVKSYLLSDQLALQGYKGKPLSFRPWNGQLRQPILLASARSLVAAPPLDGFLHPKTELDTLGFDQPETQCK